MVPIRLVKTGSRGKARCTGLGLSAQCICRVGSFSYGHSLVPEVGRRMRQQRNQVTVGDWPFLILLLTEHLDYLLLSVRVTLNMVIYRLKVLTPKLFIHMYMFKYIKRP